MEPPPLLNSLVIVIVLVRRARAVSDVGDVADVNPVMRDRDVSGSKLRLKCAMLLRLHFAVRHAHLFFLWIGDAVRVDNNNNEMR